MKYFIKVALSILIFFLIFRQVDLQKVAQAVRQIPLVVLLGALVLQLASNSVAAFRWSIIMRKLGVEKPLTFFFGSFFKGAFFNQGLPTSIGGDGLRILDCSRVVPQKEDAFFGVFIDRIVGLGGLLLLNLVSLVMQPDLLPTNIYTPLTALISLLLAGLIGLFFLHKIPLLKRWPMFFILVRLSQRYGDVYATPGAVSLQLGLSILTHFCAMLSLYLLGLGLGMGYDLTVYLALIPPVMLLIILPISLAGWGVREGAMIGFFLLIGGDKAVVLSFSIIYGLTVLVASLPGFGIFLLQKHNL